MLRWWCPSILFILVPPLAAQTVHTLPAEDRGVAVAEEVVYRVGGADAPEWASFGSIDEVGFDARGNLFVLDGRNHRVVVVGRRGERLREIGRRGEGPGEFMAARRMAVPREPTRTDRERARAAARDRLIAANGQPRVAGAAADGGSPQQTDVLRRIEAGLRDMTFADRVPVVAGLRSDPDGRLWVERVARVYGDPGPVDIIGPNGGDIGTIAAGAFRLPDAFGPSGLAAYIEADALGAPVVVVRRVRLTSR